MRGTGAILNPPDNRDIRVATVQKQVERPKKHITDISFLAVEDQLEHGSCVGQGEGKGAEYFERKETGAIIRLSKRYLYGEAKKIDGIPEQQGTYPRVVAGILISRGVPREHFVPDLNSLPYEEYLKYEITPEVEENAYQYRMKGYAWVDPFLENLAQAIYQNGVVSATLSVGMFRNTRVKPLPQTGRHRVLLYGYEEKTRWFQKDLKVYFRNSWGEEWGDDGDGYFYFSEFKDHIYDIMAYTDMPNEIIEKARATQYLFTRGLKKGMSGADVKELQKRLVAETAKDGEPCYRYRENGEIYFGTYFGTETEKAVQRYQEAKGIVSSGTPITTGYGVIGPTTLKKLNEGASSLHPKVARMRDQLVERMKALGSPIVIQAEYRSIEEQNALYAKGRTKPGVIVTNAKGGESFHNWRCAFDIAFGTPAGVSYHGPWGVVGKEGKALGLEWGGDWASFPDQPHFQFTAGYSTDDFKAGRADLSRFA